MHEWRRTLYDRVVSRNKWQDTLLEPSVQSTISHGWLYDTRGIIIEGRQDLSVSTAIEKGPLWSYKDTGMTCSDLAVWKAMHLRYCMGGIEIRIAVRRS